MIEIKSTKTGKVIHTVDADTLVGADLSNLRLGSADFRGLDLSGANFENSELFSCDFSDGVLTGADLGHAYIDMCRFIGTKSAHVSFDHSAIMHTTFRRANLERASLISAYVLSCGFQYTFLDASFWSRASVWDPAFAGSRGHGVELHHTLLANCTDLEKAEWLDSALHLGPSSLDRLTLVSCIHGLPDRFLEGCGYTRDEIVYLRALYTQNPIQYMSCFISHAEPDLPFANQLLERLRASNVSCWHYKADMRGGRDWRHQIDEAIKVHDKLLLVCSERAIYRPNVVREIIAAIRAGHETGRQKLFPIRLDDHILKPEMREEGDAKTRSGEWSQNWVYDVQKLHIPDFSGWETDPATFDAAFQSLLADLRASETTPGSPVIIPPKLPIHRP